MTDIRRMERPNTFVFLSTNTCSRFFGLYQHVKLHPDGGLETSGLKHGGRWDELE